MATSVSTCRSCSAPIEWRDGANGKRVPVDVATGESHFKTCPDARTWSRQNGAQATPASSPTRDVEIRRLACLKAAATFAAGRCLGGGDVKTPDVLKVAEAFEQWVVRGGERSA